MARWSSSPFSQVRASLAPARCPDTARPPRSELDGRSPAGGPAAVARPSRLGDGRLLRAVQADAVASAALRLVERLVGGGEKRGVVADAALRDGRDPQADGDRDVLAPEGEFPRLDRGAEALGDD